MGMDVFGNSGNYFRNSVWSWRPLADYVQFVAPEVAVRCEHWQSNDGDGLNAESALELAEILEREIATGKTDLYAYNHRVTLESLPDHDCDLCAGTGVRTDRVGQEMGMPKRPIPTNDPAHPRAGAIGWCNGCNGAGRVKDFETHYHFDVENVREFAAFLRHSNGFRIC